ncbi:MULTISPECIES: macrodomain Ter protein MatP [Pasteurellaceae]|uniref:Macrodomain Ter protein n=1 Tax=Pasteurella atlantica TaxID=2827233 RepID=A0AAW8CJT0_9PAST|nr:macrodomain Ter protein MatP [Pasteurella atlantica]MBR0573046.1 macrodomain Ter protein MatP [Pasteurella atlantica]MDP8038827.1 macrodomain Ter protein MatP [Pasteurella atlantica]MDP8041064.1 macrodomain Ter protein MatP [Pasteurella atlantica]MDP8043200.1 macrodomain Ter protein MatP [Pasteurella atlantica]MDP8045286.1 macrodomain Ter protein MatP [Pasteurella atlantica]
MRYQRLDIQEANWKWQYLLKKHQTGEAITKHQEQSLIELKIETLIALQNCPEEIEQWVKTEMTPEQRKKMRQSVRAKRKRFFNAEKQTTKKKSIDLEYSSWLRLSEKSKELEMTLSETIEHLIDELDNKQIYIDQIARMKQNLKDLLK